jgi:hypothetical protein
MDDVTSVRLNLKRYYQLLMNEKDPLERRRIAMLLFEAEVDLLSLDTGQNPRAPKSLPNETPLGHEATLSRMCH